MVETKSPARRCRRETPLLVAALVDLMRTTASHILYIARRTLSRSAAHRVYHSPPPPPRKHSRKLSPYATTQAHPPLPAFLEDGDGRSLMESSAALC